MPNNSEKPQEITPEDLAREALAQTDLDVTRMVPSALKWMNQFDILSEWHINNIIVTMMSVVSYLRNIELSIDPQDKIVIVTVVLGLYSLLSKKRISKLEDEVSKTLSVYAPGYKWVLKFKYGRINK